MFLPFTSSRGELNQGLRKRKPASEKSNGKGCVFSRSKMIKPKEKKIGHPGLFQPYKALLFSTLIVKVVVADVRLKYSWGFLEFIYLSEEKPHSWAALTIHASSFLKFYSLR